MESNTADSVRQKHTERKHNICEGEGVKKSMIISNAVTISQVSVQQGCIYSVQWQTNESISAVCHHHPRLRSQQAAPRIRIHLNLQQNKVKTR